MTIKHSPAASPTRTRNYPPRTMSLVRANFRFAYGPSGRCAADHQLRVDHEPTVVFIGGGAR